MTEHAAGQGPDESGMGRREQNKSASASPPTSGTWEREELIQTLRRELNYAAGAFAPDVAGVIQTYLAELPLEGPADAIMALAVGGGAEPQTATPECD